MRIAYLILAHNNPKHLHRLIDSLSSSQSYFFIHLDKKAERRDFDDIIRPDVQICAERINCSWGNISLVDATLKLAQLALAAPLPFDYFVLLSGSCYPVQPIEYINAYFSANKGKEFIEVFALPNAQCGKTLARLTHFWISRGRPFAGLKWRIQLILNKILPARNYRKVLQDREPVSGSQWWALSAGALLYVMGFLRDHPDFYRFCRHIDCPDEFVFPLILWNSTFRSRISHSLTFTDWLPGKTGPENIDSRHLPFFRKAIVLDSPHNNCPNDKQEVLFARKFSDDSAFMADLLDDILAAKRAPAPASPSRMKQQA